MQEIDLIKYAKGELSTTDTTQEKCRPHSKYTAIKLRFLRLSSRLSYYLSSVQK